MSRPKQRARQVMGLAELSEADIAALEAARPPEAAKRYDDELGRLLPNG